MFTNIVGYTALMQENESAAAVLRQRHQNKVGDSMMCRSDIFLAPLKVDSRFKDMEALVGEVPLKGS